MGEEPVVADPVKARLDVPFQHPLRCTPAVGERRVEEHERVCGTPFRTEAIGMVVGSGLRDWFERQQVECLHGTVVHRGNA
jgi:hypothetical protein